MSTSASGERLMKIVYLDGPKVRALRGFVTGETADHLFFVVRRPLGDEILLAKSSVQSISPAREWAGHASSKCPYCGTLPWDHSPSASCTGQG